MTDVWKANATAPTAADTIAVETTTTTCKEAA
jgi:hypothetical protein